VDSDQGDHLAAVYLQFAPVEARGRSALYEELARGVATDRELLPGCAITWTP
jgi:hypothetical protein